MSLIVDINCDLGEGFGNYNVSNEREIMHIISSCNIACGFHAGDPDVIVRTINLALENGVKIGAHPSYPDLQGFGRRVMEMGLDEVYNSVLYQVSALKGMVEALGGTLHHVKPHGALYNHSSQNMELTEAIFSSVKQIDPHLRVYGLPNSSHQIAAINLGLPFVAEGFGDRKYAENGHLVSRKIEGSVLHDSKDVFEQIHSMVTKQEISLQNGSSLQLKVDTICIHGDNPNSISILKYLKEELPRHGIFIK